MKLCLRPLPLTVCLVLSLLGMALSAAPATEWEAVTDAINSGTPRTAITALEKIMERTREGDARDDYVKAFTMKLALTAEIEGNKAEEKITRLQAAIPSAPAESQPMLQAILAHWCWQFYQQNRWRFLNRTHTAEAPGTDMLAWDLPRILAEIDRQFSQALVYGAVLKQTSISEWDGLLEKGTLPDSYRPTLFDFIAYEALSFYAYPDHGLPQAKQHFELPADSPILAPTADFLAWTPETEDTASPTLKAIRLYQELLRFHADDANRDAWLDADLARLVFGANSAHGDPDKTRYAQALEHFIASSPDHSLSALATSYLASKIRDDGDLVQAHALASKGRDAFPNTVHGNACHNLIEQIEAKHLRIDAERVWNSPSPEILVQYGNLTTVSFRLVRFDWHKLLGRDRWRPEELDGKERDTLLTRDPDAEWSEDLPPTPDYKHRAAVLAPPGNLAPGFYYLIASSAPDFTQQDNIVLSTPVWVSTLSLVTRTGPERDEISGFVLDAEQGTPLPGATVTAYFRDKHGQWKETSTTTTDDNGLFTVAAAEHRHHWLHVTHGDQQVSTLSHLYSYNYGPRTRSDTRITLFTDRAIYRPGQTIHFKGICLQYDQATARYETRPGYRANVSFRDANDQEIATQSLTCNDYGSFSGAFTAPRDRVMGQMRLHTGIGSTHFRVEEYKRPKFQVSLDLPETSPRLNDRVTVKGKAMTYSGAPVDSADLSYRVVRRVRYPYWFYSYCWWLPDRSSETREIASGRAQTDANGAFTIEFTALPDKAIDPENEPVFTYAITADITDSAGETRSANADVQVAYTALQATLSAKEWNPDNDPTELTLQTASMSGVGEAAVCTIKLHRLVEPETVHRRRLQQYRHWWTSVQGKPPADLSDPDTWELGKVLKTERVETDAEGKGTVAFKLKPGIYRAVLTTADRYDTPVRAMTTVTVVEPESDTLKARIPFMLCAPAWSLQPGDTLAALWGSGYKQARAFVEIEHRDTMIAAYWTDDGDTQQRLTHPVTEALRGGFSLHVTMVRDNRAYLTTRHVSVPWTNKQLSLSWEHLTSKLKPGLEETWTAVVKGPDAERATAEVVATLYDASLDAFVKHQWPNGFGVFYHDQSRRQAQFHNHSRNLDQIAGQWRHDYRGATCIYTHFPRRIQVLVYDHYWGDNMRFARSRQGGPMTDSLSVGGNAVFFAESAALEENAPMASLDARASDMAKSEAKSKRLEEGGTGGGGQAPAPDLDAVSARANLNETAFFMPHLVADEDGVVRMTFTMPEALTTWRVMAFAHDNALRAGFVEGSTVTSKELMLKPNAPRFLREGDVLHFTAKVLNQSPTVQNGTVRLQLFDAATDAPADTRLGNADNEQAFTIPAGESRAFSWRLTVPDGAGVLRYRVVGASSRLSDGEEGYIPVLSKRRMVTESLPLPIRGPAKKEFTFTKLVNSGDSDTLQHYRLTAQMVSNPSWYAIMALPYLMEYPHECAEQAFNRLYANALAQHIAGSNPRIRRVFDQWRDTPALDSPLEKNEDLKSVLLQETPWVRDAKDESAARRRVGLLFDANTVKQNLAGAQRKVSAQQRSDGAWSWFPGGPVNPYITLYIMTGYGRLQHLDVSGVDVAPAHKAIQYLDGWILARYEELKRKGDLDKNNLSSTIALYLYGRSFFLHEKEVGKAHNVAVDYFLDQGRKHWLTLHSRQSKAHLAIALKRFGSPGETPHDIVTSIREYAVTDDELGMLWRDTEYAYWWYHAPIETQALMIELFDEVANDQDTVEACKVWLLKQKQTQNWKTTKATADAVYALLLRGSDVLADTTLVSLSLGGEAITPQNVEAGTGFYEQTFLGPDVRPAQGHIVVEKTTPGVAWGSVHWQYLEDIAKITPHEGTPLKLTKGVFIKRNTDAGPELVSVTQQPPHVGDELVVRIELRTDRDMEYLHMKDQRGSGTEPVNVLSRYTYQDGLAYYESTRDTATHFFIDYLPKGTYVFEYSLRVFHRGSYPSGLTEIQCMYAPEFNSHSASQPLNVTQ